MTPLALASLDTPLGEVAVTATGRGVASVSFERGVSEGPTAEPPAFLRDCLSQLEEYFAGKRTTFDSLPLAIAGTEFQMRVWDALMRVPFGETRTYGELAEAVGDAHAARAVGTALGRNPIAVIVPCHRIVPAEKGSTGQYASGAWRKEWLLTHERTHPVALPLAHHHYDTPPPAFSRLSTFPSTVSIASCHVGCRTSMGPERIFPHCAMTETGGGF